VYSIKTVSLFVLIKELAGETRLSLRVVCNLVDAITMESMWHGMPVYLVNVPGNKYPADLVWGNDAVDLIGSACDWSLHEDPGSELKRMPGAQVCSCDVHITEHDADFIREKVLQRHVKRTDSSSLPTDNREAETYNASLQVTGPTMEKLMKIVRDFPAKYPRYSTAKLKLKDDVRPWIGNDYGANSREQHVFSAILREHFKLSDDTAG